MVTSVDQSNSRKFKAQFSMIMNINGASPDEESRVDKV